MVQAQVGPRQEDSPHDYPPVLLKTMKRFWLVILSLFTLALIGEPLYAMTPQQKRAKAKEVQMRKKEAEKRKRDIAKRKAAEKKRKAAEKKHKEARRKRLKEGKPLLYVYSYDLRTGEPLPATHVTVQDINAHPAKKPKLSKDTDTKRSRVSKGLPFGKYWAAASRTGYFASDTVFFNHREDEDTVRLSLYPETRLTFTVTDSLTSRPVSANVIVYNSNHERVMQTTSDSLHSLIAVLLDDRNTFYTIDATSPRYYPFHDTIADYTSWPGVVMAPREVKSFVLHNIYFATAKTRILETSEPALNELYQFLSERPKQRIRIVGHTDNIGSDRSNQVLSEGRCMEVKREMTERGIDPERIEIDGRGERDPIVPNDSDDHRQMNRRVEIVLL